MCVISFKALGFGFVFVFQFSKPLESTLKLQYWMMRERERETETELCVFGFGIIFDGGEEGMGIEEERMAHGIEWWTSPLSVSLSTPKKGNESRGVMLMLLMIGKPYLAKNILYYALYMEIFRLKVKVKL